MATFPPGSGAQRLVTLPDPAAGTDWIQTVPTAARWRILRVHYFYFCSAAVANRRMALQIQTTATITALHRATDVHTAGELTRVHWIAGFPNATFIPGVSHILPIDPDLILRANDDILSVTDGIQAGDAILAIRILLEEWIEP